MSKKHPSTPNELEQKMAAAANGSADKPDPAHDAERVAKPTILVVTPEITYLP